MSAGGVIGAPEKLTANHDIVIFNSGEPALDEWLRRRALRNVASGASRTYVVCDGNRVTGYYTLAVGSVAHDQAAGRIKRNMPDPVPVMVIGRLAVDRNFQRRGIGSGLLRDAMLRPVQAAKIAGIRAILLHAKSKAARQFYEGRGFIASPVEPFTVMITVAEAMRFLG